MEEVSRRVEFLVKGVIRRVVFLDEEVIRCMFFFLSQKSRSEPAPQFSLPLAAANTQSAHSLTRGLTAIRTPCCSGKTQREKKSGRGERKREEKAEGEGWEMVRGTDINKTNYIHY